LAANRSTKNGAASVAAIVKTAMIVAPSVRSF